MKIVGNIHHISVAIGVILLVGLAPMPSVGAGNGTATTPGPAAPTVIVKTFPVYVNPPNIVVSPSAVTVVPSDPSLWERAWTVLLTLATIGQAVVAYFLFTAARRQADAANKQVFAADAQADAAKEQVLVAREQIRASKEQLEEAQRLRLTSERPMLSLQIFDDPQHSNNHQVTVHEENGDVLLATNTTIVANNHGIVPSYDTVVTIRVEGYINGSDQWWSDTLPFNVVPANRSVMQTIPIFLSNNYEPAHLGYDTAATLEVELSATYRNSYETLFEVLGRWTVQPFITTTSLTTSDDISFTVRSSYWKRVKNESITDVPLAEVATIYASNNHQN